jgi:hypothetical protein
VRTDRTNQSSEIPVFHVPVSAIAIPFPGCGADTLKAPTPGCPERIAFSASGIYAWLTLFLQISFWVLKNLFSYNTVSANSRARPALPG